MPTLSVIGVPSTAASHAAGQDQAPRALRDAVNRGTCAIAVGMTAGLLAHALDLAGSRAELAGDPKALTRLVTTPADVLQASTARST